MKIHLHIIFVLLAMCMVIPVAFAEGSDGVVANMPYTVTMTDVVRDGLYTGETLNGIPHGYGVFAAINTEGTPWHYLGQWVDGKMYGQGGCYWDVGQCYVGTYRNNAFVGGERWVNATNILYAGSSVTDLSSLGYSELVALKDEINLAMWNSEDWQEVTVPQGVWLVGEDIPAGHWTVKCSDGRKTHIYIKLGTKLDQSGQDIDIWGSDFYYADFVYNTNKSNFDPNHDKTSVDLDLKSGTYVIIDSAAAVFTPYSGKPSLGFK